MAYHRRSGSLTSAYHDDPESMSLDDIDHSSPRQSTSRGRDDTTIISKTTDFVSFLRMDSAGNFNARLIYFVVVGVIGLTVLLYHGDLTRSLGLGDTQHHITDTVSTPNTSEHPILGLVAEAERKFERMAASQSKTLDQAVEEYRRRYNRRPPPSFALWYQAAVERDFVLIDEWDTLMQSLEPFWGINPKTLAGRVASRFKRGGTTMMYVVDNNISSSEVFWQVEAFKEMMATWDWQHLVKNVTILIDGMDEPTESVDYNTLQDALESASQQRSSIDGPSPPIEDEDEDVWVHNFSHDRPWEFLLDACPPHDHSSASAVKTDNQSLPFVSDLTKARDPCQNPFMPGHHGIWLSPSNLLLTKHLLPVLTQARPQAFNDIPQPQPFYWNELSEEHTHRHDLDDKPWEERLNRVYWVGSAIGGRSDRENWRRLQRQRMVLLTDSKNKDPVTLLKQEVTAAGGAPRWVPDLGRTWGSMQDYFHLKVGATGGCTDSCDEQIAAFEPAGEDISESFGSKYCLDIDGMGFSGRYVRLLRSSCAVMKQTVFVEWLDSWLVPWVHYIPITLEAKELGEATRFLIDEPQGRGIGRKIAEQGKEWSRKVLRREDMSVYFMRLLIELERIMSPERNDLYYAD